MSNNKLFCRAYREELATKKSSLESHIRSQKHVNTKKKLALKNKEEADMIDGLKAELPAYLAAAEDVSTEIEPVAWWKSHSTEPPKWADAFRYILLVQPSSAAAERVFSILQGFTAQQQSSLEDYIELSVMLQYNCRSIFHDSVV